MNNLLVWPLNDGAKIIFSSQSATLSTITCCDLLDINLVFDQKLYPVVLGLSGCQISEFKRNLFEFLHHKIATASLQEKLIVRKAQLEMMLIEIGEPQNIAAYFLIKADIVQAWIAQLDLLEVVMQENENEKKSRTTGCC